MSNKDIEKPSEQTLEPAYLTARICGLPKTQKAIEKEAIRRTTF